MHQFVFFDNKMTPASDAFLPAVSSLTFYGKGVFTTIAIKNKEPFLWEKHWRRLNDNAGKIGIDLSEFSEVAVKNSLAELIKKNGAETARARITFFDETAGRIWQTETNRKTTLLVTTADSRQRSEVLRLTVSPFSVNSSSPLAGVKSCNYLENLLTLEEARRRGFDEAVRLNERKEIVSTAMANLFWVKNEKIYTPALETGCLAGTTREFLSENLAIQEVAAGLDELAEADEIFLTSAGIGVCQANFGGRRNRSVVPEKIFLNISRLDLLS